MGGSRVTPSCVDLFRPCQWLRKAHGPRNCLDWDRQDSADAPVEDLHSANAAFGGRNVKWWKVPDIDSLNF